ncbi:hypothetical protein V492_05376, partial [Pseudogymnoascus sp. VKM F-4246]
MAASVVAPPIALDTPPTTTAPTNDERESKLPIFVGGKELLIPAVQLLAPIFETDPLITYFLNGLTREQRNAYLPKYFTTLLTAAGLNQASFYHTDEQDAASDASVVDVPGGMTKGSKAAGGHPWRSGVVLLPPGSSIDNPLTMLPSGLPSVILKLGWAGVKKMLFEFEGKCKAARKEGLRKGEEPYY